MQRVHRLPELQGGNLFVGGLESCFGTDAFQAVSGRTVEKIDPCQRCAIRHFCGARRPAEAHELQGDANQRGACCEFYEEQVRYALRLIADGREDAFLWDGWDNATDTVLDVILA